MVPSAQPLPARRRYLSRDREADAETGWRSLTAPSGRQIVAAAARYYAHEVIGLAGSIRVRGNAEYVGQA
jgi:hypothetical protein